MNVLVSFSSPKRHNKKRKGVETGTQPSSSQLDLEKLITCLGTHRLGVGTILFSF